MSRPAVRRLRPYLFHGYRRFHARRALAQTAFTGDGAGGKRDVTHDYEKRVGQLEAVRPLEQCYPRLPSTFSARRLAISKFREAYGHLQPGETSNRDQITACPNVIAGRISSVRSAGSRLVFLDVTEDGSTLQGVCQLGQLESTGVSAEHLKSFAATARKGDFYAITGWPHRTARGELSILATELPQLLSPSLHQVPTKLDDAETRARYRYVDMLVNRTTTMPLLVRHRIEQALNAFFNDNGFIKVNTPLLTAGAGGAVARPFETEANEFDAQKLNLRIAPELWLKRLVVGGLNRVYEIGPAFRNEGVDATHNPEFSICEFYQAFATLEDLMHMTESLLSGIQNAIEEFRTGPLAGLPQLKVDLKGPYKRLEFLPELEAQMGCSIPDLSREDAHQQLIHLFHARRLDIPAKATLPRLLDALAAHYLESLCQEPTFIINHPAALSPLSKHFVCGKTGQVVAARAELFVESCEYANMYEEENSPFEQRRKFQTQLQYRAVDGEGDERDMSGEVDESYLEALEWGLPPTGGWGCGIDRLVMLFSGSKRISDVLPFGTLRNVVGLAQRGR